MRKAIPTLALSTLLSSVAFAAPIVEQPWLRNHLPADIAAYARIPNPLFFFTEADTPLKPMYANTDYQKQVTTVKSAAIQQIEKMGVLNQSQNEALTVLFQRLRAPIELALVGEISQRAMPTLLVATQLDYPTTEALEADLAKLLTSTQAPVSLQPDKDGNGLIVKRSRPVGAYYYDAKTGRFLVSVGANNLSLGDLNQLDASGYAAIARAESLIDESGQGLLLVAKAPLIKNVPIFGKQELLLKQLGLLEAKEIALGFGVANGQSKIKAYVDMPKVGIRALIPAYETPKGVDYYGQLGAALTVSLPDDNTLSLLAHLLEQNDFEESKAQFEQQTGVKWARVSALLAHAITFVSDDNGRYAVVSADFATQLRDLVTTLNEKGISVELSEKTIGDKTLNHLNLRPAWEQLDADGASVASLLYNNHYYWVKEGDAILISAIPQVLLARTGENKTPLASAYSVAKDETPATFLSFIGSARNLSQKSYYQHLGVMNSLSDFANVPFDITAFPTADKLSLERYGTLGLRINNGDDLLSIELTTTNGAMDALSAMDGMSGLTIASVGVLAAITIPAYQNYILRSKLTEAYVAAQPLQYAIEEAVENGQTQWQEAQFSRDVEQLMRFPFIQSASVDKGTITLQLHIDGLSDNNTLSLRPIFTEGRISAWTCGSQDIPKRYLPSKCLRYD